MEKIVKFWYALSLPPPPEATSQKAREKFHRALLISHFTLFLITVCILALPILLTREDRNQLAASLSTITCYLLAIPLNRRNYTTLAGVILASGTILSTAGTLYFISPIGIGALTIYYSLCLTIIVTGAFLPPRFIFFTAFLDELITYLSLTFKQRDPAVDAFYHAAPMMLFIGPLLLQTITALTTYLFVKSFFSALRRADDAERIAQLQQKIIDDKQQLEQSITHIAHVHAEVANGNLHARANLHRDNVLWAIAVPLNNLLSRASRWQQDSQVKEQLETAIDQVSRHIHNTAELELPVTNTALDPLLLQLREKGIGHEYRHPEPLR